MITAAELLRSMRNADFDVSVNGDTLLVLPARWIDEELASLIRTHKHELVILLKSEPQPTNNAGFSARTILRNLQNDS